MTTALMPEEPKSKADDQALTLRMPRDWHEFLRKRAFDQRRSMTALILDAIGAHYELPPRKRDEG